MKQKRSFPSNGQLANIGDRWIVACGSMVSVDIPCEILDIEIPKSRWQVLNTSHVNLCTIDIATVGFQDNWLILAGGQNNKLVKNKCIAI
jgi:hypothetical protein